MSEGRAQAKTSLDYLIENEALYRHSPEFEHKRNEYISSFVQSGLAARMKLLADSDPAVRKLVNHKKLRKELTESYGALVQLERLLRRLPPEHNRMKEEAGLGRLNDEGEGNSLLSFRSLRDYSSLTPLAILDVCSGKGITAFLLALLLPTARVVMLDSNCHINRDHLAHPACSHISFVCMDIFSKDFELVMRAPDDLLLGGRHGGPSLWLVLGTHLCGHLSSRLASVFTSPSCAHLPLLVLSPCCMPRKQSKQKQKAASRGATLLQPVCGPHAPSACHVLTPKKRCRTMSGSNATASCYSAAENALLALYAVDATSLAARLRRNGWDPYDYWCLCVLLLFPEPVIRKNLLRDCCVQSDKDAFITALRSSALSQPLKAVSHVSRKECKDRK